MDPHTVSLEMAKRLKEAGFPSDDCDKNDKYELVIHLGGNGDWYIATVPEGEGCVGRAVRLCTSGGASTKAPGLTVAISNAFSAIIKAQKERTQEV